MRLRHTAASPFVRKVLVFAHECGLADRIDLVPTNTWDPHTDLVRDNPIGKVPTLITADGVFLGSLSCCDYLDTLHGGERLIPNESPRRWQVMRLHALADGAMEAAVASVTERTRRPQAFVHQPFVERQHGKIWRTLAIIEAELPEASEPPDLGQVTLGCVLGYLDFRFPDLDWRAQFPRTAACQSVFQTRASMAATQPRAAA